MNRLMPVWCWVVVLPARALDGGIAGGLVGLVYARSQIYWTQSQAAAGVAFSLLGFGAGGAVAGVIGTFLLTLPIGHLVYMKDEPTLAN